VFDVRHGVVRRDNEIRNSWEPVRLKKSARTARRSVPPRGMSCSERRGYRNTRKSVWTPNGSCKNCCVVFSFARPVIMSPDSSVRLCTLYIRNQQNKRLTPLLADKENVCSIDNRSFVCELFFSFLLHGNDWKSEYSYHIVNIRLSFYSDYRVQQVNLKCFRTIELKRNFRRPKRLACVRFDYHLYCYCISFFWLEIETNLLLSASNGLRDFNRTAVCFSGRTSTYVLGRMCVDIVSAGNDR